MKVKVKEVIEEDTDRVLLGGNQVPSGKYVTFHIRKDDKANVNKLIGLVEAGEEVVVEL